MNSSHYASCLWPGLPELWYRGKWSGLPAALIFAGSLNFLLIARFVYPEWLQPSLVKIACWVAVGVWIMVVTRSVSRLPQLLFPRVVAGGPDRYPLAHQMYLRSQWPECEAILAELLEIDPRDCQALLMLSAIYRKTERWEAAKTVLESLNRLETADSWWQERDLESKRLEEAMEKGPEDHSPSVQATSTTEENSGASTPEASIEGEIEGDQMSAIAA